MPLGVLLPKGTIFSMKKILMGCVGLGHGVWSGAYSLTINKTPIRESKASKKSESSLPSLVKTKSFFKIKSAILRQELWKIIRKD